MSAGEAHSLFCIAETASGKIEGVVNGGIRQFKAVPYGASTGGRNRFLPPQKPAPWRGVRDCFGHGRVSPQVPTDLNNTYGQLIHFDRAIAEGGMGEDCLHLNIWTPALRDGGKRPVMVSFHGGGFAISSGNAAMYDGAQLARLGDVVVVTATHRLASFGFLNLVDLGAPGRFASAGSAGIMDLVLALKWVRDNIVNFGGDPQRVMIFGQSGGGWKTSALLATPAAKGLFHRAAVQSGSLLRFQTREEAARISTALVAELGLTKKTVAKIRDLPWRILLAAQTKIGAQLFTPVLDGKYLPHHPFDPAAPEESATVPLIVSTTLDDASLFFDNFDLDENGLKQMLHARYGEAAETVLRLYRSKWPHKSPFLMQAQIVTDSGFRRFAYAQAERKAVQARAPVYLYQWDWATPAFEGRFGAVHATDVSASFGNVRDAIIGAGTRIGRGLCEALAASWVAFAHCGDPNSARIPHWPAFGPNDRAAMIFDDPIRVVNDHHGDIRAFWNGMPPAQSILG
ncbi:MAG: carboxylesterase/lipase family protein [Alphaproteobacteria bacterium]|nr:carboxylesterase/lipase family protein [Alphaproteobacteria bacterium]